MNASETLPLIPVTQPEHEACLSIGSNIQPEENIPRAVELLRQRTQVTAISTCWQTSAVGKENATITAPDFINLSVCLKTSLEAHQLKEQVIGWIEQALGRVRTQDKYAPRTIDLDIILFDGQVVDSNLWERVHIALPVSEIFPDLPSPRDGAPLMRVAQRLQAKTAATPRYDMKV